MKKLQGEDKAGLYITVIVHLAVIIVLLAGRIGASLGREKTFVIDFSREEALERRMLEEKRLEEEAAWDEEISRKLEEMIAGNDASQYRNVAVNRSSLKDDRGTDADQLYKDAERLAKDLRDGVEADEPDDSYVEVNNKSTKPSEKKQAEYSGPSVVSYTLDGRKASSLPIPAYRCYGGGMVTVIITVDNSGRVVNAKVQEGVSSTDRCLREFAVRAARMSRFSSDPKAPPRQTGDIVYMFIAQ
ncbi:MAG: energy transducer TonB [Candidatus Cryptobacteroides sp.]